MVVAYDWLNFRSAAKFLDVGKNENFDSLRLWDVSLAQEVWQCCHNIFFKLE